ncbi:hypothetical protein M9H77_26177 [Catharanthus roseus]|uniref:Uncharacterized protein n=1 Tax=Catharanthus roseus TaxID=4058 RepID=A0ACC0A987_CATRO|nr:hypothetical protein M9H77_26177 [Catharanthus roseus]
MNGHRVDERSPSNGNAASRRREQNIDKETQNFGKNHILRQASVWKPCAEKKRAKSESGFSEQIGSGEQRKGRRMGGSDFSSINGSRALSSINDSNKFGSFPHLDSEQWSKLLTLLNNPNSAQTDTLSGMKNLWILDSGYSDHMTGRKDF